MAKVITQAQFADQSEINQLREVEQIAFFNEDGTPFVFETSTDLATTTTAGLVKQAAAQTDSVATDVAGLVTDFNALLTKLRASGVLHA